MLEGKQKPYKSWIDGLTFLGCRIRSNASMISHFSVVSSTCLPMYGCRTRILTSNFPPTAFLPSYNYNRDENYSYAVHSVKNFKIDNIIYTASLSLVKKKSKSFPKLTSKLSCRTHRFSNGWSFTLAVPSILSPFKKPLKQREPVQLTFTESNLKIHTEIF